jgi:hypothetical protein
LHDAIGVLSREGLLDGRTVCKGRQNDCLHGRDSREGGLGCQGLGHLYVLPSQIEPTGMR